MDESHEVTNLGTPVPVDVAQIEQELTSLWKSASEREGEGAVMRACSCNLVALAQDEKEAVSLASVLGKVSEFHPCRSIIAYREENGDDPGAVKAGIKSAARPLPSPPAARPQEIFQIPWFRCSSRICLPLSIGDPSGHGTRSW